MKLIIVPGFLGHADGSNHLDLVKRAGLSGIDAIVVESTELACQDFMNYRMSSYIEQVSLEISKVGSEAVGLVGVSLGGVVACMAALGKRNIAKLVCVVSPYMFGCGDDIEAFLEIWKSTGYRKFDSSKYGQLTIPYEFVLDAQKFDARVAVPQIGCPKLFIAGSLDTRVPSDPTLALSKSASEPRLFRLIEGMRHDYKNQPEFVKLVNDYALEFVAG